MKDDLQGFGQIPNWVKWLAQDANGNWWGYEAEPHEHDHGWYENESGRCIQLLHAPANPKWRDTLKKTMFNGS